MPASSVTLRYCIKTANLRITQIMPHDNPGTLVPRDVGLIGLYRPTSCAYAMMPVRLSVTEVHWRIGRVSYIRISLCYFCFRWKTVSLVQASMQRLMHYVTVRITLQNNCINITSIFVILFVTKNVEFATFTHVMIRTVLLNTGSSINIE